MLAAVAASLMLLGCVANVRSGRLLTADPYLVHDCRIYALKADFRGWPQASDNALKLGREVGAALKLRGIPCSVTAAETSSPQSFISGMEPGPGTIVLVVATSIVIQSSNAGTSANGVSFYDVYFADGPTGAVKAQYNLRVATGAQSFKSAEGGFADTARDFVASSLSSSNQLTAPAPP